MLLKLANRERRRWLRIPLTAPVRIMSGTTTVQGFAITLSEGGMYLFAVANLPIGEMVEVEFKSPNAEELIRILGMIRNRAVYLYGLEFLGNESLPSDGFGWRS
jgi:PilZ domain